MWQQQITRSRIPTEMQKDAPCEVLLIFSLGDEKKSLGSILTLNILISITKYWQLLYIIFIL